MSNDSVTINPVTCTRCGKSQYPAINRRTGKIITSKTCYFCRSPYYQTSITRKSVSETMKNYQKSQQTD